MTFNEVGTGIGNIGGSIFSRAALGVEPTDLAVGLKAAKTLSVAPVSYGHDVGGPAPTPVI